MSVICESLENMPIIIIKEFVACQDGILFTWEDSRKFHVGDKVKYLAEYEDPNETLDHLKWMVKFKCDDGTVYSASQLYFVTLDEWGDIVKYFKNQSSNTQYIK